MARQFCHRNRWRDHKTSTFQRNAHFCSGIWLDCKTHQWRCSSSHRFHHDSFFFHCKFHASQGSCQVGIDELDIRWWQFDVYTRNMVNLRNMNRRIRMNQNEQTSCWNQIVHSPNACCSSVELMVLTWISLLNSQIFFLVIPFVNQPVVLPRHMIIAGIVSGAVEQLNFDFMFSWISKQLFLGQSLTFSETFRKSRFESRVIAMQCRSLMVSLGAKLGRMYRLNSIGTDIWKRSEFVLLRCRMQSILLSSSWELWTFICTLGFPNTATTLLLSSNLSESAIEFLLISSQFLFIKTPIAPNFPSMKIIAVHGHATLELVNFVWFCFMFSWRIRLWTEMFDWNGRHSTSRAMQSSSGSSMFSLITWFLRIFSFFVFSDNSAIFL